MTSIRHALFVLAVALLMAACTSTPLDADTGAAKGGSSSGAITGIGGPLPQAGAAAGGTGGGTDAAGAAQSRVVPVDLTKADPVAALSKLPRVVYFDFDSYVVKDEFRALIEAHAKALATDSKLRLTIEGHTDERGGREYNLALGQKRAEAVLRALALLGAGAGQVEAVSFGKERPAETGSNEEAWAKNRRAELVNR